jgi:hypothetical protein
MKTLQEVAGRGGQRAGRPVQAERAAAQTAGAAAAWQDSSRQRHSEGGEEGEGGTQYLTSAAPAAAECHHVMAACRAQRHSSAESGRKSHSGCCRYM